MEERGRLMNNSKMYITHRIYEEQIHRGRRDRSQLVLTTHIRREHLLVTPSIAGAQKQQYQRTGVTLFHEKLVDDLHIPRLSPHILRESREDPVAFVGIE